ncbi:hypothetical protein L208DRAFT_1403831 [Tricholoma matsutake]|nr:hypothetical protein L208DRAFT_1403831 [Tricholoma matsutake 945]
MMLPIYTYLLHALDYILGHHHGQTMTPNFVLSSSLLILDKALLFYTLLACFVSDFHLSKVHVFS